MKRAVVAFLATLVLLPAPLAAQGLESLLPSLTWPEGDVVPSTKGCAPATAPATAPAAVCAPGK